MKPIINLTASLITIILYFSCDTNIPIIFDGSERYSVTGRIVDKEGHPMANIWVYIRTCKTNTNCNTCGYARTRSDGQFEIIHSTDDAAFYSIHINDYILDKPDIYPNSRYHNISIKYNLDEYVEYSKDFGDIGYLDKAVALRVLCRTKSCQFSVTSNKMDSEISDFEIQDRKHKYYTIDEPGTKTIYVPKNDTIMIEYKKWQLPTPFFPIYGWEKITRIITDVPVQITI